MVRKSSKMIRDNINGKYFTQEEPNNQFDCGPQMNLQIFTQRVKWGKMKFEMTTFRDMS